MLEVQESGPLVAFEAAHATRRDAGYSRWDEPRVGTQQASFLEAVMAEAQAALDAAAEKPVAYQPCVYLVSRAHMPSSKRFDKASFWLTDWVPGVPPVAVHGPVDFIEAESGHFGVDEADILALRAAEERTRLDASIPQTAARSTRRMRL